MSKFKKMSQGGQIQEQVSSKNPLVPKTRNFYLTAGQRRTVIPLDDDPIAVRRHRVWLQNPPSTEVYSYRLTCACADPFQYSDIEPRTCRACNGIAMGHKALSMKDYYYITVIAEGELMRTDKRTGASIPTGIWDYKYVLEMNARDRQRWDELKDTYGGSLVARRITMYRTTPPKGQKSKTSQNGDSWSVLGDAVDLRQHFWRSPAIPRIVEWSQRSTTGRLDHEGAVRSLITAADYDAEFDNYSASAADRLVAIAAGKPVEMGESTQAPGGYAAPPLPGAPPAAPTGYPVPPPAPAGYPAAPGGYAPPPAPAGYAGQTMAPGAVPTTAPPPPVPDPAMAPPAPQAPAAYAPPPMPGAPAPAAQAAPAPVAPPATAPAPAGAGYSFDQGWSPGFPPPTAPAPAAAPAAPPAPAAYAPPPMPPATPAAAPPAAPLAPTHYETPPF